MRQSRLVSLVEVLTNVAVGYGVAVLAQIVLFPQFRLVGSVEQKLVIGLAFSVVSIVRSYLLRRLFEVIRGERAQWGSSSGGIRAGPAGPLVQSSLHPISSARGRQPPASSILRSFQLGSDMKFLTTLPSETPPARDPGHRAVLVLVHPGAVARGPSVQIQAQCELIRAWPGPLFILDEGRPFPNTGNVVGLREVLGAGLEARKHARQIAAPAAELAAAVTRLFELAGARRDFLLTGAGTAIAGMARLLEHAGGRARVHPSAVTYD